MKTVITITESRSMPGRFTCTVKSPNKRTIQGDVRGTDPAAAAARAVEASSQHGAQGYYIFAPQKVLDLIPTELHNG